MSSAITLPDRADLIRVMAVDGTPMKNQLLAEALAKHSRLIVFQSGLGLSQILADIARQGPDLLLLSANLQHDNEGRFKIAQTVRAQAPQLKIVLLLDTSRSWKHSAAESAASSPNQCQQQRSRGRFQMMRTFK